MALDQQETFNWLVTEKARLEAEVERLRELLSNVCDTLSLSERDIRRALATRHAR